MSDTTQELTKKYKLHIWQADLFREVFDCRDTPGNIHMAAKVPKSQLRRSFWIPLPTTYKRVDFGVKTLVATLTTCKFTTALWKKRSYTMSTNLGLFSTSVESVMFALWGSVYQLKKLIHFWTSAWVFFRTSSDKLNLSSLLGFWNQIKITVVQEINENISFKVLVIFPEHSRH